MGRTLDFLLAIAADRAGDYALIAARVGGLVATAPGFGTSALGWRVRVGLAIVLTLAVAPAVGPIATRPAGFEAIARLALGEFGLGAALGIIAGLVIAGARQAGDLVGMQAGLAPASLIDPEAGDDLNPLGHLYGGLALGVFLAMDGPLVLVGSLVESYRAMGVGEVELSAETVDRAFARIGWGLSLAIRAAAPAALAMAIAGAALGLLGRAAPSLGLISLSMPARIALGLVLAMMGLAALAGVFESAWMDALRFGTG